MCSLFSLFLFQHRVDCFHSIVPRNAPQQTARMGLRRGTWRGGKGSRQNSKAAGIVPLSSLARGRGGVGWVQYVQVCSRAQWRKVIQMQQKYYTTSLFPSTWEGGVGRVQRVSRTCMQQCLVTGALCNLGSANV